MKFYYLLYPRPVVIIGSGSVKDNKINFMSVAWITPISENPPTLGFSSYKENYSNILIEKFNQFSVIIVNNPKLILELGSLSGKDKNKVEVLNLNVISGKKLDVPLLKDYIAFLECKLIDKKEIGECVFYIGEVINWEIKGNFPDKNIVNKIPLHKGGRNISFLKN
ncbi:MAG: flavin reductase family protein [Nanopusillaceae archaeon]